MSDIDEALAGLDALPCPDCDESGHPCVMCSEKYQWIKTIRTALEQQQEWQPIETAPMDGTRILLSRIAPVVDTDGLDYGSDEWKERMFAGTPTKIHLWWATAGFWSTKWGNWNDGIEPSGLADPTHWMPLPVAPTPEQNDDASASKRWVSGRQILNHYASPSEEQDDE